MFWDIFIFELKYRLKRPATWIYFFLFFLLMFLSYSTGNTPAPEKVMHDGPYEMMMTNIFFGMVFMLVTAAVMGVPLYRDLDYGTRNYLFSYPIKERNYFWGRFWGSFFTVVFIGFSVVVGGYLGTKAAPLIGVEPADRYANSGLLMWIKSYFLYAVPNLFISSALFFSLVSLTKNQKVIYASGITLFILYLITAVMLQDIENQNLIQYIDGFGMILVSKLTRYWTPYERNTLSLPFTGEYLFNRIIFIGLTVSVLIFAFLKFRFSTFQIRLSSKKLKKLQNQELVVETLPVVNVSHKKENQRNIFWNLVKIEFLNVVRDNYFRIILLAAVAFLIIDFLFGFSQYSVKNYPITAQLVELKNWDYTFFIYIILIFFAGETIHREKTYKFNIINDALPVSNRTLIFSKLFGMAGIAFILALLPVVITMIYQTLKGHFDYDLDIWFVEVFLISFPGSVIMMLLAFAVHLLINNKWAAHGVTVGIYLLMWILRRYAEMDFNMLFYSYTPEYKWSEMNGIGHFVQPLAWFNFYWLMCGLLLLLIGTLFFVRGIPGSWKERIKVARHRFSGKMKITALVLLIAFLGSGAFIYYNTNILNTYTTIKEGRERQVLYEKTLKKYEGAAQPRVTELVFNSDIFPEERRVKSKAFWKVVNKTDEVIRELYLSGANNLDFSIKYNGKAIPFTVPLEYKKSIFTFFKKEKEVENFKIYQLDQPMKPGDSAIIEIDAQKAYKGFPNKGMGRDIVYNGTFLLYDESLPEIGYNNRAELESDKYRKKYGLKEKVDDLPPATDEKARNTQQFVPFADYVKYRSTVSTSADQIAVSPGYLKKTWEKDGRRYFEYVQDEPMLNFFTVVSAKYDVLRDKVKTPDGREVNIEIYHHKDHNRNLDRFVASYKDGLQLFSKWYGPFQYRQMRLLEFPRYEGFAQSFANTVPFSEDIGWVADFRDPNSFDYGYYVAGHELAHQWFGHQVTPSNTLGANMISESLAEYLALQLAEHKYGMDNMKRFLKNELDRYLTGRSSETKFERTLIDANKPYIWYQKGSLALYGLQDLIGEENMVKGIRAFRDQFADKYEGPYATSHDLYRHLDAVTPQQYKYFLEDSWKRITLYENKAVSATARKLPDGTSEVTIKVNAAKKYSDKTGKETDAPMNDFVDIGIFAEETTDKAGRRKTNPLYLKKHQLKAGKHILKIIVKGTPVKAGIDPYNKLIDRIPDDNLVDL